MLVIFVRVIGLARVPLVGLPCILFSTSPWIVAKSFSPNRYLSHYPLPPDREDHTFCGIMFPVKAKRSLPIHQIVINSLSIRGRLGPITVWVTKDEEAYRDEERKRLAIEEAAAATAAASASSAAAATSADRTSSPVAKKSKYSLRSRFSRSFSKSKSSSRQESSAARRPIEGQISMRKRDWIKIYEREHGPSRHEYAKLDLSANPIVLRPGEVRGVYIHSTLPGDEAIVYDNKHQRLTHDDPFIQILTGRAHVSEKPFGKMVSRPYISRGCICALC